MKQCPKCQTNWDDAKRFCPYDGSPLTVPGGTSEKGFVPVVKVVPTPPQGTPSSNQPPIRPRPIRRTADDTPTMKSPEPLAVWRTPSGVPILKEVIEVPPPDPTPPTPPPETGPATPSAPLTGGYPAFSSPGDGIFVLDPEQIEETVEPPPEVAPQPVPGLGNFVDPQTPIGPDDVPHTVSVIEIARRAREGRRAQSEAQNQERHRTQAEYFKLLNDRNRLVQQFIDLLAQQGFRSTSQYRNEETQLLYCFNVTFGERDDKRVFPITVALYRKPTYSVVVSIDLLDIGPNAALRLARTQKIGGQVTQTEKGPVYHLDVPEEFPNEYLLQWLDEAFKLIFTLTYEI